MTTQKLTDWFNLSEQKPWEPGVYQVLEEDDLAPWWSYWNGEKFGYFTCIDADHAYKSKYFETECIVYQWRGIAEKPKARGNRKVTRYVVMAQCRKTNRAECDGTFAQLKNAELRMESTQKIAGDTHNIWIQKIRFRTPEAD